MKKVFQGLMYAVWQYEQKLFDGSVTTFEKISRSDYACAIGVLPDEHILLVEDEQPDRKMVLTPPGGRVEDNEQPVEAAKRELQEETGYSSDDLVHWYSYSSHTKLICEGYFFVARDIKKISEPKLEAGERIKLVTYTFDEFLHLGQEPKLRDLMLRIKLLEALVDPHKKEELRQLFFAKKA